jgi:hypothetical protein
MKYAMAHTNDFTALVSASHEGNAGGGHATAGGRGSAEHFLTRWLTVVRRQNISYLTQD